MCNSKKNIPEELLEKLVSGDVTPFIGAGFSKNFGYSSWRELLDVLCEELYKETKDNNFFEVKKAKGKININPLMYAEALYSFFEQWSENSNNKSRLRELAEIPLEQERNYSIKEIRNIAFNRLLLEANNGKNNLEGECEKYINLKKLNFRTVVTTNYDTILEDFIFTKYKDDVYYPSKNLEINTKATYDGIFKIHGDKKDYSSVVFTNRQYYRFMRENKYIKNTIYNLFVSSSILFIGYGFNDINVLDIYFNFISDYSNISNIHQSYMLFIKKYNDGMNEVEYILYKEYLAYNKIIVIDEFDSVEEFVNCLYEEFKQYKARQPFKRYKYFDKIKSIILSKLDKNEMDVKNITQVEATELFKLINEFFDDDKLLGKEPFIRSLDEGKIVASDAYRLLDIQTELIKASKIDMLSEEYFKALRKSIALTANEFDYYKHDDYLKRFIKMAKYIEILRCDEELKEGIFQDFTTVLMDSNSNYKTYKYWYSYKVLIEHIKDLPIVFINEYLTFLLNQMKKEGNIGEEYNLLVPKEIEIWLDKFIKINAEFKDTIDSIFRLSAEYSKKASEAK